jgi:hypothetical protein
MSFAIPIQTAERQLGFLGGVSWKNVIELTWNQ